jgi:hypothetical protein
MSAASSARTASSLYTCYLIYMCFYTLSPPSTLLTTAVL